jgi:hypothetical protein
LPVRFHATHEKVIAVSLELQRITRTQTHPEANLARYGESPSAEYSGLLPQRWSLVSDFFHVVGPCPKNNKRNHRLSGNYRRGVCSVAVARTYQSGAKSANIYSRKMKTGKNRIRVSRRVGGAQIPTLAKSARMGHPAESSGASVNLNPALRKSRSSGPPQIQRLAHPAIGLTSSAHLLPLEYS